MHKNFSDWYRAARIEPVAKTIPLRWAGVERFEPGKQDVVTLTKFFFGLERPSEAFLEAFRQPFQAEDVTFPMQKNDEELKVLAGANLVDVIMRGDSEFAMLAALCLVSASFQNLRKNANVPDILGIAATHLNDQTIKRANAPQEASSLGIDLEEEGEAFIQLAGEFAKIRQELAVVSEESNMLWWLFSETSRDLAKQWVNMTPPAVAIVAGKELADLTLLLPGPRAALAFLGRITRLSRAKLPNTVMIKDAVDDTELDWRQKHVGDSSDSELDNVIPLRAAIKKSIGSPDKETWVPAFTRQTGVTAGAKLPPAEVGYQMFIEGLLLKAWEKSEADA